MNIRRTTGFNALARSMRTNALAWVVAVGALGAVVGAGTLALSIADREDGLRTAGSEVLELSHLVPWTSEQALAAFAEGKPGPADLAVHRQIASAALPAAYEIEEHWSDPLGIGLVPPTRALAQTAAAALVAGAAGRETVARKLLDELPGRATALSLRLERANNAIAAQIDKDQSSTRILTLVSTGVIGILLSGLIIGLGSMWRRRQRVAAQRIAAVHGERRLQALVRHGSDLIAVLSPDGKVLFAAGAVESMLGDEAGELTGEDFCFWLHPDDAPTLAALLGARDGETKTRELRLRTHDSGWRTCEARATSLLGDDLWNGIVLNIWDVTERVALEERLRHQAFHDDLTSLGNRVLFNERLEHALVRAVRGGRTVSVLIIDLDDFKSINDSLGHVFGDELLRDVAARLDEALRGADTVARLGGDEFGVIFDDSPAVETDEEAARRITEALAAPFQLAGRALPVSASVGIARAAAGGATPTDLVRDADLAMYAAKGEEKGTVAVYHDQMYAGAEDRLLLKSDLLDAANGAGNQFVLYYQPVVHLVREEVVGLEALLRWNHPTRGMLSPAEFIPIAEETGAIVAIGRRILREACEEAERWPQSPTGPPLTVSVNVSTRQLRGDSLIGHVREALVASGLMPRRLVLEITETQLMRDVESAVATLEAVRELGVRVAIDDFGTGYSSLSQLQKLPADILKVDREFTGSGADGSAEHAGLLNAVMDIGDSLGLSTVAEGIETTDQMRQLRALHYRYAQGYLFSRPVPADRVPALLAAPLLPEDGTPLWLPPDPAVDTNGAHSGYFSAVEQARAIREASRNIRLGATRTRRDTRIGRAKRS
jgi:diguanylate cyclase (GGDEF)-like protein/PAS domain S-box-containing protein